MPKTPISKMPKMPKMSGSLMNVLVMIGGVFVLMYIIKRVGKNNTKKIEGNTGSGAASGRRGARKDFYNEASGGNAANVQPAQASGNEQFASVNSNGKQSATSGHGLPPSCSSQPSASPSELLPNDPNGEWSKLNPSGSGDLRDVNLLSAGSLIGIDTVGNTLRNANLQVRSEPANPQMNVGPWHNTTIAPDTMRVPLEIGQGQQ
jgi:hypothetical protein